MFGRAGSGSCGGAAASCAFPPPPWAGDDADPARGERRDAAENRQRILAVARELFAARGVDHVSMHEIARAVGVGQGTLYRRFAHKGLLCAALLADSTRRFHGEVATRLADPSASPLALLDTFLTLLAAHLEENAPLLAAVSDASCGERRGSLYENPFYVWLHGTVAMLLEQALATGEVAPLDVPLAADMVLAPLMIDLYVHHRRVGGYSPERILATVRRVVLDGLRGEPVIAGEWGTSAECRVMSDER